MTNVCYITLTSDGLERDITLLMSSMDNSNISTRLYRNSSPPLKSNNLHQITPYVDAYTPGHNQNILSQLHVGIFEISGYSRFKYLVYTINNDADVATGTSRSMKEMLLSRPKMFFYYCFETILNHCFLNKKQLIPYLKTIECFHCDKKPEEIAWIQTELAIWKKGVQTISLCFDNNLFNFDFNDKYILVSLSIVLFQWIRRQSSLFLIVWSLAAEIHLNLVCNKISLRQLGTTEIWYFMYFT